MSRLFLVGLSLLVGLTVGAEGASQTVAANTKGGDTKPGEASALLRPARLTVSAMPLSLAMHELAERSEVSIAFSPSRLASAGKVDCHCADLTVGEALQRILSGTEFEYLELGNQIVIAERAARRTLETVSRPAVQLAEWSGSLPSSLSGSLALNGSAEPRAQRLQETGVITGRVTDAGTGRPLSGVQVAIDGTQLGSLTNDEGRYMIAGVPSGARTVRAILLGFREERSSVNLQAGASAVLDFTLEQRAIALEELVVTGSIVESRIREMPVTVAVIDAAEIEARQIQRVDQLFQGTIPGAVAWDLGHNAYMTQLSVRGRTSLGLDYIKTYIDGVEVARSSFLSTIDPQSIERIEVIRGPQASTLYGSDAIGGVLQIFTKKGSRREREQPQIRADVSLRRIGTDFGAESPPLVSAQRLALELSGGGESYSYNVGATRQGVGAYIEDWNETQTSAHVGTQITQGGFTLSAVARYADRPYRFISSSPQFTQRYPMFASSVFTDRFERQSTIGLNIGYSATENWRHNITIGNDRNSTGYKIPPRLTSPADTFGIMSDFNYSRVSLRYNTSLSYNLRSDLSATVTGGVDHWKYEFRDYFTNGATRMSGMVTPQSPRYTRVSWDDVANSGYYGQLRLGFRDNLFITTGIRAEDHDNFGEGVGLVWSPQAGATYVRAVKNVEMKIRGAWGEAIRPPSPTAREGFVSSHIERLPNPEIGPEKQAGWETGVDLLFGNRVALSATYYDQDVDGLIQVVRFDPTGLLGREQNQNVGQIRNNGWEFEGSADFAGLILHGTYTILNSEVQTLSPAYTGDLREGEDNISVPKNVFGASLARNLFRGNVRIELSRKGKWTEVDWLAAYDDIFGISGDPYRGSYRAYWIDYGPVTRAHLRVNQDLSKSLEVNLAIENLTNNRQAEPNNIQTALGRTVVLGFRYSH